MIVPALCGTIAFGAPSDGWENAHPARRMPVPAKEVWRAPLEKGMDAFRVEHVRMQRYVLLFEAVAFAVLAALPPEVPDLFVNSMISLFAAVTFENFRTFGTSSAYASVFCTGNLRSFAETLYDGLSGHNYNELGREKLEQAYARGKGRHKHQDKIDGVSGLYIYMSVTKRQYIRQLFHHKGKYTLANEDLS